jgi:catechol 2,3-dioxygenase-like lactoylglutathione lyase family enzyme
MSATAEQTALTRLNHIVLVVEDIQKAAADWEKYLGIKGRNYGEGSPLRMKRMQFDVGDAYFALCEPMDEQSVFYNFLKKRGEGIFAISFDVEGYDGVVTRVRDEGGSINGDEHSSWVHPKNTHGVNLGLHPDGGEHPETEPTVFKAFNYIVIAVKDRDAAAADWERYLGVKGKKFLDMPEMGMRRMQFDVGNGDLWISLVEPLGENSYQRTFLENNPEGVYMIAVKVDDKRATARAMQERGATIIGDIDKDDQLFVHPKTTHGLLLGLV